jgi:phage terminase small subunit
MATRRRPAPDTLEGDHELDELLPPPRGAVGRDTPPEDFAMDGLPQSNRKTLELEAQLKARVSNTPVFPFPPELRDALKPYWLELVNSFPADHFQVSDVPLMKLYCRCAYDIERTSLLIEEEGEVVIGGRGAPMVNPRVKVRGDAQNNLLALATKFRNQPASRTNTENFGNRQGKASKANRAAKAVEEGDGLLAGRQTRH